MTFLFILGTIVIVAFIFLVVRAARGNSSWRIEKHGINITKTKNEVTLKTDSTLHFNLTIKKSSRWTRMLSGFSPFQLPQSGDSVFDEMFTMTLYRDDVLHIIQQNFELRLVLKQLAIEIKSFKGIKYGHEELSMSLSQRSVRDNEELESIREKLAALLPKLTRPFELLTLDTSQEARAKFIDDGVPVVPVISIILLTIIGSSYSQPLVDNDLPWKMILTASVMFFVLQITLLFMLSKAGTIRMQGLLVIFLTMLWGGLVAMPEVIRGINAHFDDSPPQLLQVNVLGKRIYNGKHKTSYLTLAAWGTSSNSNEIAVSDYLYNSTAPGQTICITMHNGALGLPWYGVTSCS